MEHRDKIGRMTRRTALTIVAGSLSHAAERLPANKNVRWAVGASLWNFFPRGPFTDILDIMRDTGFIGIRLTHFPEILHTYDLTAAQLAREVDRRGLQVVTISFNGPAQDAAQRDPIIASAREAMRFLADFGAHDLVVFSPARRPSGEGAEAAFKTMCECFNAIGEAANAMSFRAGLHNHLGQMVESGAEVDRAMSLTDPKLFHFSPDTAHLHLAGIDVAPCLAKHKSRITFLDYKDAKRAGLAKDFRPNIYDLGDGEIDFPACHRVLKGMAYRGWICVDLDIARNGPRASYERCGRYITRALEPIYV